MPVTDEPQPNEKDHGLLFATLLAANFLGIEPLRDICCAAIANMLRAKTPDQIMEVALSLDPRIELASFLASEKGRGWGDLQV